MHAHTHTNTHTLTKTVYIVEHIGNGAEPFIINNCVYVNSFFLVAQLKLKWLCALRSLLLYKLISSEMEIKKTGMIVNKYL